MLLNHLQQPSSACGCANDKSECIYCTWALCIEEVMMAVAADQHILLVSKEGAFNSCIVTQMTQSKQSGI
jgi:hypothetical protein